MSMQPNRTLPLSWAVTLARDTAWYGAAGATAKILALLTVPILTRALGPEGYGAADLAVSTAAVFTLFAMLSADIPAARLAARLEGDNRQRVLVSYVSVVTAAGLAVSVVLLGLGWTMAETALEDGAALTLLPLAVVLVPLSAAQAALAQTQRIVGRPRAFAALALIDLGAQLSLAVVLVIAGYGPAGVLIGFVGGSMVGLVAAAVAGRDILRARPDRSVAMHLASDGAKFLPFSTAFVVADWAVRGVLMQSIGVAAVGQFGVALRLASVLSLVGAAFALAWGPIGLGRKHGPRSAALFARELVGFGSVSIAAALAIGALAPEVVRLVAGERYAGAAVVLPGVALAAALAATEYVLVVAAGITDRGSRVALASLAGATAQVGATLALVPAYGLAAIGPAVLLGRGMSFAILLMAVRREIAYPTSLLVVAGLGAICVAVVLQLSFTSEMATWWLRWLLVVAVASLAGVVGARQLSLRR